jgi:shikimate dehydrogenase
VSKEQEGPRYLAVIGHPIAHSLSPALHGSALAERGGVYLAFDVPPERLEKALAGLWAVGFAGLNVTLPHKEQALHLSALASEAAAAIGAANTLAWRPEGWYADNTDALGFQRTLAGESFREALVLGAGGAARAVLWALRSLGVPTRVCARREERAQALARLFGAEAVPWPRRHDVPFDLVVNATSAGQRPGDPAPFHDFARARPGALAYDLIYNPPETAFLRLARTAGLRTRNGLEMLIQQAAMSWRCWFGVEGPVDVFRAAMRKAGESHRDTGGGTAETTR